MKTLIILASLLASTAVAAPAPPQTSDSTAVISQLDRRLAVLQYQAASYRQQLQRAQDELAAAQGEQSVLQQEVAALSKQTCPTAPVTKPPKAAGH
jgi:hypothetical protein